MPEALRLTYYEISQMKVFYSLEISAKTFVCVGVGSEGFPIGADEGILQ